MAKIILKRANLTIYDGRTLSGPVTSEDEKVFLFRNTSSGDDVYFRLAKDESDQWHFAGGPDVKIPDEFIQQIGNQIDGI